MTGWPNYPAPDESFDPGHRPEVRAEADRPGDARLRLRASDRDREKVATLLSHAYAEGRLSQTEHDERLDAALSARTFGELIPLTDDLVPLERPAASPRLPAVDPTGATQDSDQMVAVLSELHRGKGHRLRRHTNIVLALAEGHLDLREAIFDDTQVNVGGVTFLGELQIVVPEGVNVADETTRILAETQIAGLRPAAQGPRLTLRGTVVLGQITVRGPDAKLWRWARKG